MQVECSRHPHWLSNSYLVIDKPGGSGVIIDTGAPTEPIMKRVHDDSIQVEAILCTHHHPDHVQNNDWYRENLSCQVWVPALETDFLARYDQIIEPDKELAFGPLKVRSIATPGHTRGQLALILDEQALFTGDTLFRETIGGTRAPGHTTLSDLKHSILDSLMSLPHHLPVYPGHQEPTTLEHEWNHNPFIRYWRGLQPEDGRRCRAFGRDALLLVHARDYDGGAKCLIRYLDDDQEDVCPGSRTELLPGS